MALVCFNASGQKLKLNLQGTWKLVVVQEIEDGKTVTYFPGRKKTEQFKTWAGNQVFYVGQTVTQKRTREDFGIGTFQINGNNYEENYTVSSYKSDVGEILRMKMEMENDTLVQTFFLNEKGQVDENTTHIEKYIRVK